MHNSRTLLTYWKFLSAIWLAISGLSAVPEWSGEHVSSREYLRAHEQPYSWGDKHPECRKKFGYWPDGIQMDAAEFSQFKDFFNRELGLKRTTTPEQVVRDNWARDVRKKISACEEDQWMPAAKSNAVRKHQIELILLALLPPIALLLAGATLAWIWRNLRSKWLKLPTYLRNGLSRTYLVVAVPWVAWYGYQIFTALRVHPSGDWDYVSHAFWLMLIVPIGGPLLVWLSIWVVSGFRGAANEDHRARTIADEGLADLGQSLRGSAERAKAEMNNNTYVAHNAPHEEDTGTAFTAQKREQDPAIPKRYKPASTALLVVSILVFPRLWLIDVTAVSLYWVARFPR